MSIAPSSTDDYKFPPAPARAILDRETWDEVMGGETGIGVRLRALEAKRTELQDLIDDLSFNGQARIDAAITPLIEAVETEIEGLQAAVAQAVQDAADAATDVTAEVQQRVALLETRAAAVEATYNAIIAGVVAASKVSLVAIPNLDATTVQAAIAEMVGDITALQTNTYSKTAIDQMIGTLPTTQSVSNTAFLQALIFG